MRFGAKIGGQLLALSMLLSASAPAKGLEQYHPHTEETSRIAASLMQVLNCSDRIWPDMKAASLDVLLVNKDLPRQILVSARNKKMSRIANADLPPYVFASSFSLIPFEDRQVMYIDAQVFRMNATAPSLALSVAVHEAFHMTDQTTWVGKAKSSRSTTFPFLAEPRIARSMLYANLKKAFLDKQNSSLYLGHAKYWYDQWLLADPAEENATTDGYEGTARYVDMMVTALDEIGCGATEEQLEKKLFESESIKNEAYVGLRTLDNEGYPVGSLAALILRFQKSEINWHAQVAQGKTPVEILLDSVVAVPDLPNLITANYIRQAMKANTRNVEGYLHETREQMKKSSSVYVSIPNDNLQTSFSPKGFYIDRETGIDYVPMAAGLNFQFKNPHLKFQSGADAVFFTTPGSVCHGGWDFVVDRAHIQELSDGRVQVNHPHFQGQLRASAKQNKLGHSWLCVQD